MMNEQREKEITAWMSELLRELLTSGMESQEHFSYRESTNIVPSKDGWKLISPPTISEMREMSEKIDVLMVYFGPRLQTILNKVIRSFEESDRAKR
jgi:hypothetical protein